MILFADIGIGTRGGSLASSRGYLEVAGTESSPASGCVAGGVNPQHLLQQSLEQSSSSAAIMAAMANHKNMDQSLLSLGSNVSIISGTNIAFEKGQGFVFRYCCFARFYGRTTGSWAHQLERWSLKSSGIFSGY